MKKENYNMKTTPVKRCREDVIFDTVIFIILTLILFVVAYPLYWVIISSFSDPTAVSAGKVLLRPMGFTLKGYAEVFKNSQVMPFDTGNLQNESTFADYANLAEGETKIVSSTPYARRLYFHPEYKFHRAVWVDKDGKKHGANKNAGGKWLAPWLKGGTRQNFCQKAFTRFYKQEAGL